MNSKITPQQYYRTVYFVGKTGSKLFLSHHGIISVKKTKWLCDDIVEMGPVYIKLSQIVSTRKDVFPEFVTSPLCELQDNVGCMDIDEVNSIFQENFDKNVDDLFDHFEKKPFASASIGQVHIGTLNNHKLAVKVMKRDIRDSFERELTIMINILTFVMLFTQNKSYNDALLTLQEIYDNIDNETDFIKEMNNMISFREMLSDNSSVVVPRVFEPLCCKNVLTMEYVPSEKITNLKTTDSKLSKDLMYTFVTLITRHNYLHCDPHPGNIGINRNQQIVLYDYGMVKKFRVDIKPFFKRIVFSILNKNTDDLMTFMLSNNIMYATQSNAKTFQSLNSYEYSVISRFLEYVYRYLGELDPAKLGSELVTDSVIDLDNLPFSFDKEMIYLFKTFSTLEGVCKQIDPSFNYLDMIEDFATDFVDFELIMNKVIFDIKQVSSKKQSIQQDTQQDTQQQPTRAQTISSASGNVYTKVSVVVLLAQMFLLGRSM